MGNKKDKKIKTVSNKAKQYTPEQKSDDSGKESTTFSEDENNSNKILYSFTKHGDRLGIGVAIFFALVFFMPGCSVMLNGNDFTGGLIVICLTFFPIRYIIKQWYSLKTEIKGSTVFYTEKRAFKSNLFWREPIAFYSGVTVETNDDNEEAVLRHSSDDSKNVILHSEFYKYSKIDEKVKELTALFKKTNIGTTIRRIRFQPIKEYAELNFFEVCNNEMNSHKSLKELLFPDKHLKLLQDEAGTVFTVGINKNITLFYLGGILLVASFLLLPWAFTAYSVGGLACFSHITGIILYNFGQAEEIIKAEKRSVTIGVRWLKRKTIIKKIIPFADIVSAEVIKETNHGGTQGDLYSVKIRTDDEIYFFGKTNYHEEVSWFCKAITERIIKINDARDKRLNV